MEQITQQYLSPTDAIKMTGLSRATIDRAVAVGELRAFKRGRRVLIAKADLTEWVEQSELHS